MIEYIFSFLAGMLTVLAPCVLPLLPIIIGGSFTGKEDKKRPYIIAFSLITSLILFTILLKASTVLIGVDPRVWTSISGTIVVILGVFILFPLLWDTIIGRLGLQAKSQELLGKTMKPGRSSWVSAVLTGAALGPVFSSCSPTYAWIIATVLPKNNMQGIIHLGVYSVGLVVMLLAIALVGRKFVDRIKWLSNPYGTAQKIIGILFIIVGLGIVSGYDKKLQTWIVGRNFLNLNSIEEKLVPKDESVNADRVSTKSVSSSTTLDPSLFNITPYEALEFAGITKWINSEPLSIKGLRGKVVLVDFWTYSCINCERTLPFVQKWYETYKDKGLVIIGVHAPEFAFEKVPENVVRAVADRKLTYPVAMDNDYGTWQAFHNQYWPASYLIDKNGNVRREHFGEGQYKESEEAIRALLGESVESTDMTVTGDVVVPVARTQTPETYLGSAREDRFVKDAGELKNNQWNVSGSWTQDDENLISTGADSVLRIKVTAKKVFLVMSPAKTGSFASIEVSLNGVKKPDVMVGRPDIYTIIDEPDFQTGAILELKVPSGMKLNAFTFEG